jgi:hypothetical protein
MSTTLGLPSITLLTNCTLSPAASSAAAVPFVATSAKPRPALPWGIRKERACTAENKTGKISAKAPMLASTTP